MGENKAIERYLELVKVITNPAKRAALQAAIERTRIEEALIRCSKPDPEEAVASLQEFMEEMTDPHEKCRCQLAIIFAILKRNPRRNMKNVLMYFVYIYSRYPSERVGDIPPGITIDDVTLDMIQGITLTWEEVFTKFNDPRKLSHEIKDRVMRAVKKLAIERGYAEVDSDD